VQAIIEEQEKKESKLRPNIFHKPEILKQKKDIFGLLMERTSSVEEVDLAYVLNKLAFSKDHGAHSTTTENPGRGLGLPSGVAIVDNFCLLPILFFSKGQCGFLRGLAAADVDSYCFSPATYRLKIQQKKIAMELCDV
jgi:hypothetical protein